MLRGLIILVTFVVTFIGGQVWGQTATPTAGPTPFADHSVPNALHHIKYAYSTGSTEATTIIDNRPVGDLACIAAVVLSPDEATEEMQLKNGSGDVLFSTTVNSVALFLGAAGPCVSTPVQVDGTGKATVGWYGRGRDAP